MAAWYKVLSKLKAPGNPNQQHKDAEPMLRVPEAERGSNHSKGREALQADRSGRDGPIVNRREGEYRDSADNEPGDPAGKDFEFHDEGFSALGRDCACFFSRAGGDAEIRIIVRNKILTPATRHQT